MDYIEEEYLDDGLYAAYDGYQIILAANDKVSGKPTDQVALDPGVVITFIEYVKCLRKKGIPI